MSELPPEQPAAVARIGIDVVDLDHFRIAEDESEVVVSRARSWCDLVGAQRRDDDARRGAATSWSLAEAAVKADRKAVGAGETSVGTHVTSPGFGDVEGAAGTETFGGEIGSLAFSAAVGYQRALTMAVLLLGPFEEWWEPKGDGRS